jgi:hypothetical protein
MKFYGINCFNTDFHHFRFVPSLKIIDPILCQRMSLQEVKTMKLSKVTVLVLSALLTTPALASDATDRAYRAMKQPLSQHLHQQGVRMGNEATVALARSENRLDDSDALIKARYTNQQPINQMAPYRPWQREKSSLARPRDW